jgi:hypothetical protein
MPMTQESGTTPQQREFSDAELEVIGSYQPELRRMLADSGIVKQYLAIAFGLGLAAHVVGYLLRSTTVGEPFAFIADLLYSLGFALWTGVVVVMFAEVLPQAKQRQVVRALAEYDAFKAAKSKANDKEKSGDRPRV